MNPDASTHLLVTSYGKEIWVEKATVEDEWVAAYRLMIKGGRLVVAEVRLFPADHAADRGPGEWSVEASAVPPEGVPARALRALSPTVPQERFPRFLRDIEKQYPRIAKQLLGGHGIPLGAEIAKSRPGRKGHSDSFYLAWAVAYVKRLGAGSNRPIKDLAEHPPKAIKGYVSDGVRVSEATVRDVIHQARVRGFLTLSPVGRPGGDLTPKAELMLKRDRSLRRRF